MKIALISEHASPLAPPGGVDCGGQNVYVAHVAAQLARAGHRVDVFTRRDSSTQATVVAAAPGLPHGVRVIHVPAGPARHIPKESLLPFMPRFCDAVAAYCAPRSSSASDSAYKAYEDAAYDDPNEADFSATYDAPYDVVHANFFMSGLAALHLRERYGIPFVITFHALGKVRRRHQGEADGFPLQRVAIEQLLVATADRIVAECPADRDDLIQLYDADRRRIDVIPCGFDPEELSPGSRDLRQELGLGDDDFLVLQLGRLVPRKGIDNVVRGIAQLRRRHGIRATLLIVGGDHERPDPKLTPEIGRLAEIAAKEGVAAQVHFTGRQPRHRLRRFYNAADVFVSTPWYEPFGITPVEAMACACPVIGAAVGGIRHTVMDGVTGFLVPPNDPAALADRLAQLQRNPALHQAFGRAGLRRVKNEFTWKRVAADLVNVYRKVSMPPVKPAVERRASL